MTRVHPGCTVKDSIASNKESGISLFKTRLMEFPKTMEQVLEENSVAYYAEFRSTSNVLSSILVVDR